MMTNTLGHCSPEVFEAYFDGALSETDLDKMLAHLAECPECLSRAERIGDGLIFLDTWIMEARQMGARAGRLEQGLFRAEAREPAASQKERIRQWRHKISESGLAWRRGAGQYRYALAGTAGKTAVRTRGGGRVRTGSGEGETGVLKWIAPETPFRITVPKDQPVLIGLDDVTPGEMVALVPESSGGETLVVQVARSTEAGPQWVARFGSVVAGEYVVVFEKS